MMRAPDGTFSISRVAGALCIATSCFIGIYGILNDREHSGVVASLAGVAGVALLTRDKRTPEASDEEGE